VTGRGVIALVLAPASALAGVFMGAEELVLLGIATGTALAAGAVQCVARARRAEGGWRIAAHLDVADVTRGQPATIELTLHAAGRARAVPVHLQDPTACWNEVTGAVPAADTGRARPPVLPQAIPIAAAARTETQSLRFPVPTTDRGVFRLRGTSLWCFDALCLFAGQVAAGPGATVTVLPVPQPVELAPSLLQSDRGLEDVEVHAPLASKRQHNMGDFAGLRTYVPGDRLRLLYWPALARSGELLVREFEDIGTRRVHILADVRSHLGRRGAEAVLSAAAGAGLAALSAGAVVEFSTTAGDRIAIGPGPHGDLALLRAIANVAIAPLTDQHGRRAGPPSATPHFSRTDLMITTSGGANSLPPVLRHGNLVIAQ
jgi:uncharacterized protein (DUF58 family)